MSPKTNRVWNLMCWAANLKPTGNIKKKLEVKSCKALIFVCSSQCFHVGVWQRTYCKPIAEKNKMLHSWHYKRSKSSKRSPLPYSHSRQYWHLVFLWSFALIKKKGRKNSCQDCNSRVLVSLESHLTMLHSWCVCAYTEFLFSRSLFF